MFHYTAYRGPHRGEACGLLEAEVSLGRKVTTVVNQIAVPLREDTGAQHLERDDHQQCGIDRKTGREHQWRVSLAAGIRRIPVILRVRGPSLIAQPQVVSIPMGQRQKSAIHYLGESLGEWREQWRN